VGIGGSGPTLELYDAENLFRSEHRNPRVFPEHLHEYYEKTRANIQLLLNWIASMEKALPLERHFVWSEGEENLEARLDEILAVH